MSEDANIAKKGTNEEKKGENGESSFKIPFRLTLDKRIDLVIIGVMILYGVFIIIEARGIMAGKIPDPLTSRGMPYITGILIIILGIVVGVMRIITWSDLPGNLVPGKAMRTRRDTQPLGSVLRSSFSRHGCL